MSESAISAEEPSPRYFSHEEFRIGLPVGRFRVIMNPALAQKYLKFRLFVVGIALPMVGFGVAFSFWGYLWAGLPLVLAGILLPRVIKAHAPRIVLFLAARDPAIYNEAIEYEIMEVRPAR
jgi:fatty acid desaturase